jgi:hypothetical protein
MREAVDSLSLPHCDSFELSWVGVQLLESTQPSQNLTRQTYNAASIVYSPLVFLLCDRNPMNTNLNVCLKKQCFVLDLSVKFLSINKFSLLGHFISTVKYSSVLLLE